MDLVISYVGGKALDAIVAKTASKALSVGWRYAKWLPVILTKRNERVRVSFSSFLRVRDSADRYLIIRNYHRSEFYGPIGGCHKFYVARSRSFLDKVGYVSDGAIASDDTVRDIRGFVTRKYTGSVLRWFANNKGNVRESARECLRRELCEELTKENGIVLPKDIRLDEIDFMPVRSFLEETSLKSGELSLRLFSVFDLIPDTQSAISLLEFLTRQQHANLVWANAEDIDLGRTSSGEAVGHACVLFTKDFLSRQDFPHHRR